MCVFCADVKPSTPKDKQFEREKETKLLTHSGGVNTLDKESLLLYDRRSLSKLVWSACLLVRLLLLSLSLGSPQTGLQLLQLLLGIDQQHLQGAAALPSNHLNTHAHKSDLACPLSC